MRSRDNNSFSMSWSDNGVRTEARGRGRITFTDDDRDIQSIEPGGLLHIVDRRAGTTRTLDVSPGPDGRLEYKYSVDGRHRSFEAEGRAWLAEFLPDFIRRSGIGAESRVRRILKQSGPNGVLEEITRIRSDYVKGRYFRHLADQATLDAATVQRALAQAGREISSDYELASLLIAWAPKYVADEAARKAYMTAVASISSDYEKRRALSAVLTGSPLSVEVTRDLFTTAQKMSSNYELVELLKKAVTSATLDDSTAPALFAAVNTIRSDYERRRILSAIFDVRRDSAAFVAGALEQSTAMSSSYERAELLTSIARSRSIDGAVAAPFFKAVDGIDSDYERHRVLSSVVARRDASQDVLTRTLAAASAMRSGHELGGLLIEIIRIHGVDAALRPAFLKTVEQLTSDYEHGRVMSALGRSEASLRK